MIGMFYSLVPFTQVLQVFRWRRERVPFSKVFLNETQLSDWYILLISGLLLTTLNPILYEEERKFEQSAESALSFLNFMSRFHVLQAYFTGLYMALTLLRFFFALKITRVFGPFIKVISLSFYNILVWSLFALTLILAMDNFLSILLQEDQACASLS